MLTNTIVEICSTPLTTAPRRLDFSCCQGGMICSENTHYDQYLSWIALWCECEVSVDAYSSIKEVYLLIGVFVNKFDRWMYTWLLYLRKTNSTQPAVIQIYCILILIRPITNVYHCYMIQYVILAGCGMGHYFFRRMRDGWLFFDAMRNGQFLRDAEWPIPAGCGIRRFFLAGWLDEQF